MKDHQDKWIEDVLKSTKGISRTKPGRDLFVSIEGRLFGSEAKVITTIFRIPWRAASVAAAVLLLINGFAFSHYLRDNQLDYSADIYATNDDNNDLIEPLISTFNIYEL